MSERGQKKLIHKNYLYTYGKSGKDNKMIWKFEQYYKKTCRGRLHTTSASTSVSVAASGQLPHISILKRTIRRIKNRETGAPSNPKSLNDLQIPELYQLTTDGKPFLLHDSGPGNKRILIFSTQQNLDLMSNCEHWFADGTFSTCPTLFTQIYTIHGVQYNNVLPSLLVLLPDKTENTYDRLFEGLKNLKNGLRPKTIMIDFEKGVINAISKQFSDTEISGCFFNFSQAIWRHVQSCGLQAKYSEDSEFALQVRMLAALSFVPIHDGVKSFEELLDFDYYQANQDLIPLINYFEDVWIGRIDRRNRRRRPLYPITLWNCYTHHIKKFTENK